MNISNACWVARVSCCVHEAASQGLTALVCTVLEAGRRINTHIYTYAHLRVCWLTYRDFVILTDSNLLLWVNFGQIDRAGDRRMMSATRLGSTSCLDAHPAGVHARNRYSWTRPLHSAARNGEIEVARLLRRQRAHHCYQSGAAMVHFYMQVRVTK